MITPRDLDVETTPQLDPLPRSPSTRAAAQRRAMQAAMAASVRAMRTSGVRQTVARPAGPAGPPLGRV